MTQVSHGRRAADAWRVGQRVVAASTGAILAIAGLATAAAAQQSDPQGLKITYPEGELHLANLTPGHTRYGEAVLTNHHDQPVAVDLAAEWSHPPLAAIGVALAAHLCTSEWEGTECAPGAEPVELSTEPVRVGTLAAGEAWHLQFAATLDAAAGNDTQELSEAFTLRLVAEVEPPISPTPTAGPPPDDGAIPETGTSPWSLVAIALGLLVAGGLMLARARHRWSSRGEG